MSLKLVMSDEERLEYTRASNRKKSAAWRKRNPGYEWRTKYPDRFMASTRKRNLKQRFGMTPDEYEARFSAQGGVCAICKQAQAASRGRLAVDHNHETGRVRGLLCHPCNLALGNARDNIITLRAMIDYLEREG